MVRSALAEVLWQMVISSSATEITKAGALDTRDPNHWPFSSSHDQYLSPNQLYYSGFQKFGYLGEEGGAQATKLRHPGSLSNGRDAAFWGRLNSWEGKTLRG